MLVRLFLVFALFFAAPHALARDVPLYAPAADWVKPAPAIDMSKAVPGAPLIQVFDQQIRFGADGTTAMYRDLAFHIGSNAVLTQLGTIQLAWQPHDGDLIVHGVEILRGDERIDVLASGETFTILRREEQLGSQQITGVLTATMTVKGLRVGDVLRVRSTITEHDDALGGFAHASVPLPPEEIGMGYGRLRLLWPRDVPVRWKLYGAALSVEPVVAGAQKEVTIPLPLAKRADMPEDAPMRFRPPAIFDASSFGDWPSVSRTMAGAYDTAGLIPEGSPLAAQVAKIAARTSDPRERAALALRLVQDDVRYLFAGMDGGNYTPQSPAQTWELRYGDCKAKTLLLLAILHALDIEAEPVLASSSAGGMLPIRLPMPGAFDHVLVRAVIDGETLWLDGTRLGDRLEDIGNTPALHYVLPLRTQGADLMPVPMHAPARPDLEQALEIDQRAGLNLPAPYRLETIYRGPIAEMMRVVADQATEEQRDDLAARIVGDFFPKGAFVSERRIEFFADAGEVRVLIQGIATSGWSMVDGQWRYEPPQLIGDSTFDPDRRREEWRAVPVYTGDPSTALRRTTLKLPVDVGFSVEGDSALPDTVGGAAIVRNVVLAGDVLTVEETASVTGAEIPASDIPGERAALARAQARLVRVNGPADYPALWAVIAAAKRNGGLDGLRKVYDDAVARDPDDLVPYQNRANFLSGIYEWKGAIADLTRMIEIEPSAEIYVERAQAHAQLGDDKAVLADLLAARKLDPEDDATIYALADRYGDDGRYEEALALIEPRIGVGGELRDGFRNLKAKVLGRMGRTDEALAILDAMNVEKPGDPNLLNSRCWFKGTNNVALASALKDCTRGIELAESPAHILDSRALVYFQLGRMEEALADLDAALGLAPNQAASLFLRGVVYLRLGRKEEAERDMGAARMISPQIVSEYARYGVKP